MRFEDHGGLLAAIPGPVNLVARDAHDVAGLAAIAAAIDEEIDFAGDDVIHLLAIVHVRAGVIARGSFGEHDAGVGAMDLLRAQDRLAACRPRDTLGHLHVAPVDPVVGFFRHSRFLRSHFHWYCGERLPPHFFYRNRRAVPRARADG